MTDLNLYTERQLISENGKRLDNETHAHRLSVPAGPLALLTPGKLNTALTTSAVT